MCVFVAVVYFYDIITRICSYIGPFQTFSILDDDDDDDDVLVIWPVDDDHYVV